MNAEPTKQEIPPQEGEYRREYMKWIASLSESDRAKISEIDPGLLKPAKSSSRAESSELNDGPEPSVEDNEHDPIIGYESGRGFADGDDQPSPTVDGTKATEFDSDLEALAADGVLTPTEARAFMTPAERLTDDIHLAALNVVLRRDGRSFEAIGAELGVGRQAISKAYRKIMDRVGGPESHAKVGHRAALSAATKRTWAPGGKRAKVAETT